MAKTVALLLAFVLTGLVIWISLKVGVALIPIVHMPVGQQALKIALPFIMVVVAAPSVYRRIRTRGFFSVDL